MHTHRCWLGMNCELIGIYNPASEICWIQDIVDNYSMKVTLGYYVKQLWQMASPSITCTSF